MQDGFKPRLPYSIQKAGRSVRDNPLFGTGVLIGFFKKALFP